MNIHESSYYPTRYSLDTENAIKQHKKTNTTLHARKSAKANIGSIYIQLYTNVIPFEVDDCTIFYLLQYIGRAIAEAVSRWLPTAAARVQTRV
jgi:hypothetical protein